MPDPLRASAPPREPTPSLVQIALAELARRRDLALADVAARRRTVAQAEALLRPWAAIATWFGADVRPLLVPHPGVVCPQPPHWIDFAPRRQRADDALRAIAEEARRAARVAVHRAEDVDQAAHPEQRASACGRAADLLRLDHRLAIAAGLPPIDLSRPDRRAAA